MVTMAILVTLVWGCQVFISPEVSTTQLGTPSCPSCDGPNVTWNFGAPPSALRRHAARPRRCWPRKRPIRAGIMRRPGIPETSALTLDSSGPYVLRTGLSQRPSHSRVVDPGHVVAGTRGQALASQPLTSAKIRRILPRGIIGQKGERAEWDACACVRPTQRWIPLIRLSAADRRPQRPWKITFCTFQPWKALHCFLSWSSWPRPVIGSQERSTREPKRAFIAAQGDWPRQQIFIFLPP
jgi:hypothetical protein